MRSIENDRELDLSAHNPFTTEIALYEKDLRSGDIVATVVVPDYYHVGFPNIGHQMVEWQLNQTDGFFADRCYLTHDHQLLKQHAELSPEIVFISMSYEGSYIRAVRVLDLMGIPLRREDRHEGDPVVVIGGWSVSRNPLPLFELADVIGIGDSEDIITDITMSYKAHRHARQDMVESLSDKDGIILPSRYKVATQNGYLSEWVPQGVPLEIHPRHRGAFPHSLYLSSETDYNDIGYYDGKMFFSMEIVDACTSKCIFCASGYKPKTRDIQNPAEVVALAEWGARRGADLIKLFFPANSSVPATKQMMLALLGRGLAPRVGSAKAEKIDREYIDLVARSGQEKIAFAPETGDYELRKCLGKPGMTDRVLDRVTMSSVEAGIPNLDYYLIMNLPGEAPESFRKTIDLVAHFHELARAHGFAGRIRISVPNFFPKASTPLQYAAAGDMEEYSWRIATFERELGDRIAISTMKGSVDLLSQNILSRGGPEAGQLLVEVYRILRAREQQTGHYTPDTVEDWRAALAALGLPEHLYFEARTTDKPLPWHHVHASGQFLPMLVRAWQVFQQRRALVVHE